MTEQTTPTHALHAYPDWVTALPEVDTSFPGAHGHLLSGAHGQLVLWRFDEGGSVPVHSHGPQLGMVLSGCVRMIRGGRTVAYRAGESFSLADGEDHGADISPGTLVMELFAENDRHHARAS
ncbi:cupin domain-containing protein [Streptomyces viridochromogenes]|uniref:cupin domain-containing protein n=1 Tax=Streptomyces viridochromogenes TaxID=1938 RepID=UPI00065C86FD|nr:cupin domain-containing protein [Streptomyces viridochromogenes]